MIEVGVFLSGEGANELGSRAGDPSYQSGNNPGVIQAPLTQVQKGGRVGGYRRSSLGQDPKVPGKGETRRGGAKCTWPGFGCN